MNKQIPRLIKVHPKLLPKMEELYPDLKPFFSTRLLKEETVFSVLPDQKTFVDDSGVMFLNMDTFRYIVSALNEFFRTYQQGENLKAAFVGFMNLLSGEVYGNYQKCH